MNWFLVGIVLLVIGVVLIIKGKQTEKNEEAKSESIGQTGYLLLLFGIFAIVAQYLSIGDTMFIFVTITGVLALVDKTLLRKRRVANGANEPGWVEFSRGFFPVLLLVFLIRGFLVEPYQIPSSSMRPGLLPGDFILVNKFSYGLRAPLTNHTLVPISRPQQGDVMVFKYPNETSINYIKRVIGLPGDVVSYHNKVLKVNGKIVSTIPLPGTYSYISEEDKSVSTRRYDQHYGEKAYSIIIEPNYPPLFLAYVGEFSGRDHCQYDEAGFECTVPSGQYFMMGDNRDHSGDSRYWGFVPENYIIGKALLVWLNFSDFSRIGKMIE